MIKHKNTGFLIRDYWVFQYEIEKLQCLILITILKLKWIYLGQMNSQIVLEEILTLSSVDGRNNYTYYLTLPCITQRMLSNLPLQMMHSSIQINSSCFNIAMPHHLTQAKQVTSYAQAWGSRRCDEACGQRSSLMTFA